MTSIENGNPHKKPPLELRLRVLSAIDYTSGESIQTRIKKVSERTFVDEQTGCEYRFTWRTISTWLYRFKKRGITTLDNKTRADKNSYRKIQVNELAEAINEIIPTLSKNKAGTLPKLALYRKLLTKNYFQRSQLSQTSFYRMVRENNLLNFEQTKKLRHSFAMQFAYTDVGKGREHDCMDAGGRTNQETESRSGSFANELWQANTMYGPSIKQPDGSLRKTFLIAFIDDASRVITHGDWFLLLQNQHTSHPCE